MANRVKEDEKNERIIRNLLKLPDNRRCINCNSLGPQYVCTNFWTFVCTTCSGIHREFTHRVKSVSMAKFTSQEVSALQAGGNARAKEIYFKEWDSQRSVPDSSNVERLRDFIKHVYVDRRYTGDKSFDKPPRMKMGEAEDTYENRRDTYQGGSRSPPYEDAYERRYSDRPSPGGRSPGYDQESRQYGDFGRSPARTEIVNDWRREDRFGNGRKSDDSRISDGSSKLGGRSPDHQKDPDMSSPPIVRPVREILGENISPLRIIEPPKHTGGRAIDGSVHAQRTASSSSLASSNGNAAEVKVESLGTLIDFDTVPEPPTSGAVLQTPSAATGQSVVQPTASPSADNWANFDSPAEVKVTQASSKANSLESVLSELTVPASVPAQAAIPGQMSIFPSGNSSTLAATPVNNSTMFPPVNASVLAPVGQMSASPFGVDVGAPAVATTNIPTFPSGGVPVAAAGLTTVLPSNNVNSVAKVTNGGQWPTLLSQQQSFFPPAGSQATAQPFAPTVSGHPSSQPWNSSLTPNAQGPSTMPVAPTSQSVLRPAADVTLGVVKQSLSPEVMPSGRQALPEDLFTASYPSSVPLPGWQRGPPHGFGFNMQYNAVPMQTFTQSSRSVNPFDLSNETSQIQAPTFPSMASLQGALPNMVAPTQAGLLHNSSLGTPSPTWMPSQLSYSSVMPPQAPSFTSAIPPSAYMGQHIPNNLPPRQQPVVGFGGEGAGFGSLNPSQPHQQLGGIYSAPATPNTFSAVGGNPFG
ncbi:probable ADP-ribosylation factor GTPase-activating protein AGD14 [Diospyros lotus]|uniref:probable ADP-ribosylation factor GTPase-activating protein AGD14 n=1 Tax=Diospyros lotus TaxID=55363 RepID=UPI00224DE339|nr:probable ADP-ribosylation factor GTPase-activating protein AGD14 [Diospyros lotus]